MGFLTESFTLDCVSILVTLLLGLVLYLKWSLGYWERLGVPSMKASLPYGNAKRIFTGKASFGEVARDQYKYFKSKGVKFGGVYLGIKKMFIPVDTEVVKNIMQRDFSHFMNHGNFSNPKIDPLSGHLFNLEDSNWRNMRVKLTPTFTSGKMKMMFQTLVNCGDGLKDIMDASAKSGVPVDVKDTLARFSTDIIGSCAFGLECNSLKDPDAIFRKMGKQVFESFEMKGKQILKVIAQLTLPKSVLRLIRLKLTDSTVEKFFIDAIKDTVEYREKNKVYRKDFMHLLLQLKNRGMVTDDEHITDEHGEVQEHALTMNELAAQAFVFFLAGFETSSTTMTFALYELASNPDIQTQLQAEISSVLKKHNGKLTYDAVMDMKYLENVLYETLRKYPPLPILSRECNQDYQIPGTNITLTKGTAVQIPVLGLQTDPEYYPDPEKFDPDRFLEENKNTRPLFSWIPFGEGPRLCIGLRFGLMQSKVGIITLLRNYKIKLSSKTQLPLQLDHKSFITAAAGGIWLEVEALK